MNTIKNFEDLYQRVVSSGRHARIAVANAKDEATQEAIRLIKDHQLADVVCVEESTPRQPPAKPLPSYGAARQTY